MKQTIKLLACVATLVMLAISVVPRAAAHHYVYVAEDPTKQSPPSEGSTYTDNWVMWQWQQGGTVGWWVVPSSDPTFADDVNSARESWRTNISELGYSPATSEDTANIRFRYETPPSQCGTPPPWRCNRIIGWENRATENASYIR